MNSEYPKYQICFSTQNQMVNFISVNTFKPQELFYFTLNDPDKNKKWDENFKWAVKHLNFQLIKFMPNDTLHIEYLKTKIKEELKNHWNKNFLWNITGGQRNFLIASYDIFRQPDRSGDVLCYIEGNTNNIITMENVSGKIKVKEDNLKSDIDVTISEALKLMGFEKTPNHDFKFTYSKNESPLNDRENILEFLEFFKKFNSDRELREICLILNKKEPVDENLFEAKIEKFPSVRKSLLENRAGSFGKVFEYMVGAKIDSVIRKSLSHRINELAISTKIIFESSNITIDEFDIALITRDGKFLVFECKTGVMSGDIAKSHRYSTYAIGGVYGMPILLVPLTSQEINTIVPEYAKNLKITIGAARRAQLEIWGIDEIENNLCDKIR